VDRGIADVPIGQASELDCLVFELAVRREDGDLLERDDIGIEVPDDAGDQFQSITPDMPPPGGRERIAWADGRADVPGRDPDGRRGVEGLAYLTDPASSPWTK
jgi:hypothetical protein